MSSKLPAHDSAVTHVCGEAQFLEDRDKIYGELLVQLITSEKACAKIKHVDYKKALEIPGVEFIFSSKDIANNCWGPIVEDQPILAKDQVNYVGEPILIVAVSNINSFKQAKKLIKIEYQDYEKILSIDVAIQKETFLHLPQKIVRGDFKKEYNISPHTIEGTFECDGQDHFYLESQSSICYPGENGQLEIHSSSQHPTEVQHVVANALNLKQHQVVCTVKRMGGAFGGKESQAAHFATCAALVTQKTNRVARILLSKDIDMQITGKRHAYKNNYQVGFTDDGKITSLKVRMYANGGAYVDLSPAVLQRSMLHIDNCYNLLNCDIEGKICKTNLPPNTAFRGFGAPQAIATIESIIEEIAYSLCKDPLDIRRINCYAEGDLTPYEQEIPDNILSKSIEKLSILSHYKERKKAIEKFNQQTPVRLHGISVVPIKFGISFTAKFLNQGNALVNIHKDGTIQVSTGGTEMGQGLNTKIAQTVADALTIPYSDIKVMPTSTEKNHNTSATAASSGSDINCAAALLATNKIKDRLTNLAYQLFNKSKSSDEISIEPSLNTSNIDFINGEIINKDNPGQKISFQELVSTAYMNRISLGDYAFFKTPNIHYDVKTGKGRPFLYYTNGVACSEVSVDRYTGDIKLEQVDILMDLGRTINKYIDFGQIAGGFTQCTGWILTESLFYSNDGKLLSDSPTTYKIPNIQDTPRIFNINLIENPNNQINIKGSKAVGEPPFALGTSVWTALKHATNSLDDQETKEYILKERSFRSFKK